MDIIKESSSSSDLNNGAFIPPTDEYCHDCIQARLDAISTDGLILPRYGKNYAAIVFIRNPEIIAPSEP